MGKQQFAPRVMKDSVKKLEDGFIIQQPVSMLDIDGEAVFCSAAYAKIFGTRKNDQNQSKQRLSVVKITNEEDRRSIYRVYRGASIKDLDASTVMLSPAALQELGIDDCSDRKVSVSQGCRWMFYRNHPNAATRISFRIGMLGVLMGLLSIVVSIMCCVIN